MKKWFIRIIIGLFVIFAGIIGIVFLLDAVDKAVIKKYVKNDSLPTIKADWQGTPIDEKGRFVNAEFPFLSKMSDVLKWQLGSKPQKQEKANDAERLKVLDPAEFLNSENDGILWLGHASFFIRINGVGILTDPVFGNPSFIKKLVDAPSPIEKLKKVDYVLISHDHRDHCDEATIKLITQKFPNAKLFGGLRMDELFNDWKTPSNKVQTAGWFQQFETPDADLKIFFVPIRHWSRRGLFDTNQHLWGGYVIQTTGKTIYFGGDSGYGVHYKQVAELFPEIDLALIGVGAYSPRWFMEPNHNSPEDAVKAFGDLKAKILVPMHYGTFDLSDEPPSEPLRLLKDAAEKAGVSDQIKVLQVNESLSFK